MDQLALRVVARFQTAEKEASETKEAVVYRQRGKAYRKRRQQYRKNKSKSKRQSKMWRQRNKAKIKRYRQKAKRNPMLHRMKKRAALYQAQDVQVWDVEEDLPGEVQNLSTDDETVTVDYDGKAKTYDVLEFLDRSVFVEEPDEDAVFTVLDEMYRPDDPDDEEDEEDDVVQKVARRFQAQQHR